LGVWGTAIFSDDLASDIRGDYTDALGDGLSGPEATQRILKRYRSSLADPDESSVVWLALAATQWKLGRPEPEVIQKALEAIDSGSDLKRWSAGTPDYAKRWRVLENWRQILASPPPAEKRVTKRKLYESPWKEGDLFSYRVLSGRAIVFRVIEHHSDKGGRYPVCKILDWVGREIPSKEILARAGTLKSRADRKHTINNLMLVGLSPKWAKRIQTLDVNLTPLPKQLANSIAAKLRPRREPASVVHFKHLDKFLSDWFLLE
jgi:hypothetical protein